MNVCLYNTSIVSKKQRNNRCVSNMLYTVCIWVEQLYIQYVKELLNIIYRIEGVDYILRFYEETGLKTYKIKENTVLPYQIKSTGTSNYTPIPHKSLIC